MNNKIKKWEKWLDIIYKEIYSISLNRYIYKEIRKIVRHNRKLPRPNLLYRYLNTTYAISSIINIRKQVKIDKQSISLARLIDDISSNPNTISRKYFVTLYKFKQIGENDFNKFSNKTKQYFDKNIAIRDLKKLESKTKKCEKYADKRIAHFNKGSISILPNLKDLDRCIDFMEEVIKKYYLIISANCLDSVIPNLNNKWKDIFKIPWLKQ